MKKSIVFKFFIFIVLIIVVQAIFFVLVERIVKDRLIRNEKNFLLEENYSIKTMLNEKVHDITEQLSVFAQLPETIGLFTGYGLTPELNNHYNIYFSEEDVFEHVSFLNLLGQELNIKKDLSLVEQVLAEQRIKKIKVYLLG